MIRGLLAARSAGGSVATSDPSRSPAAPGKPWKNALYNFFGFLWPVSLLLISIRYLVDKLGYARFGTWLVANAFLSLAAFAQFGLNDATTFYVAKHEGAGDRDAAARAAGTTIAVYLGVGLLAAIILWFSAPILVGTFMGQSLTSFS